MRSPLEKIGPRELPRPASKKKPRRLDDAEVERLFAAAKTKTPGYHALFVLLAFTGLRIREALALAWADVDVDDNVVRVEPQLYDDRRKLQVKTANALRKLPIYPRLRRVLVEHRLASTWTADDDPVFAPAGGRRRATGTRPARSARASPSARGAAPDRRARARRRDDLEARRAREPNVTMRVDADDFRKTSDRNAAMLARAAERGFVT